jgi:hypothetical protein
MSQDLFRLEINRTPIYNDGKITYQLTAVCSVTASSESGAVRLDQNTFVKKVEDSSFVRVANASDLGLLKSSVAEATASGHSEYRDSVSTFDFEDVDTAVAAIPVLRDRVNASVYNYIKYVKRFESLEEYPSVYNLPLPVQDQEARDALILSYTDSRQARQEAEAELVAVQATLDTVGYKEEFLSDLKKIICDLKEALDTRHTAVSTANAALIGGSHTVLDAQINMNFTQAEAGADYTVTPAQLTALRSTANIVSEVVGQHVPAASADLSSAVGLLNLQCQALEGRVNSLRLQTNTLKSSMDSLSVEVSGAARTEASTIADLSEYCPEVDPNDL